MLVEDISRKKFPDLLVTATRNEFQKLVTESVKDLRRDPETTSVIKLSIDDYSLIEIVVSKLLLIAMDNDHALQKKKKVGYLIAMHQEQNRLKKGSRSLPILFLFWYMLSEHKNNKC